MFWDYIIHADRGIETRRPNMVVFDKKTMVYNIGIAVPGDFKVKDRE